MTLLQRVAVQKEVDFVLVLNPRAGSEGLRQGLFRGATNGRRLSHADSQFVLLDESRRGRHSVVSREGDPNIVQTHSPVQVVEEGRQVAVGAQGGVCHFLAVRSELVPDVVVHAEGDGQ